MFDEATMKEINEAGRKLSEAFQETKEKLLEAWKEAVEPLQELAEAIQKAFGKIEEHKRLIRRPPKWYVKANNPAMIVNNNRLYHCRNNC